MTDLTVLPIAGFATAAHRSGYGMLSIRHLPGIPPTGATQAQLDRATQTTAYAIAPEQCRELAQALLDLATRLDAARNALN